MCLAPGGTPASVADALAAYRVLLAAHGPRWAESPRAMFPALARYLRFVPMMALLTAATRLVGRDRPGLAVDEAVEAALADDLDRAFRDALGGAVPAGLIAVRLTPAGVRAEPGPARAFLPGQTIMAELLLDSALDREITVWGPGGPQVVPAGGARLVPVELDGGPLVLEAAGEPVRLDGLLRPAPPAALRLRSAEPSRWSVLDADGTGWFPEGALRKWDAHGRAFFHGDIHGDDVRLDVPAGPLTVRVARGMDYGTAETTAAPGPGAELTVALDAPRLRDPAAHGWYGGDLHLHMNFGGDQVCEPGHAAAMQHGEGLPVMNLLAANCATGFVFDREALEAWAGRDLPWSAAGEVIARMGAEFRNDLLGHLAGFAQTGPLTRYNAGHADSERDQDHPPNAAACTELRELGAVVSASHPFIFDLPEDGPPDLAFEVMARSCDARELVADAALGLVDGVDVLTHNSCVGTAVVYRRLLGAGLRLAATAGTDVFLSYARCATHSNPPGWARVYARLDGPLSTEAFAEALRRGRTFATNGPWLELDVDGHGPGDTVNAIAGEELTVRARASGPGVRRVRIRTADGVARTAETEAVFKLKVREPTYLVAEADGPPHPEVLDPRGPYAHSSPVFVDVAGRHVARPEDVAWCLDWLDRLERLLYERGAYRDAAARDDVVAVLNRARDHYRRTLKA